MIAHHHTHHGAGPAVTHVTKTPIPHANWPIAHGAFTITWHEQFALALIVATLILMALVSRAMRRRNPRRRGRRSQQSSRGYYPNSY